LGRRGYPPEFRRKVLDLLEEGRGVAQVANDLDISEQSIYTWRRQDRIDRGLVPGLTSKERSELSAANKRIVELETELKAARRALELLREEAGPKGGSRRSR
jgi:transposase-like protein